MPFPRCFASFGFAQDRPRDDSSGGGLPTKTAVCTQTLHSIASERLARTADEDNPGPFVPARKRTGYNRASRAFLALAGKDLLATSQLVPPVKTSKLLDRLRVSTRTLRHRNFRLFIMGQGLTMIGTWVQSLAQSWLVYRLSRSPVMLGVVSFASLVPYLVLSPVAGVVCDRVNRRKLILVMRMLAMLQAALLAVLTLTGRIEVWHVFYLALALGVFGVFEMTARQSFLVEMVGKEDLMNAIALNSSVYNSGRIIGPAIA